MKRKVLGLVLLVISILGVSLGGSTLFAQYYVPPYDPFREQNSELAKIDQATQDLAAQLRGKHDAAKEAELKKLVEELFAKRHAAQVAEAKALADKLAKLQDLLKKREEKKAEIVARRVKQLLGETDDLDWNPNARQENLNLIPSYGFSPDGRSLGVLEVPRKSKETPNKPEPIPGLPMMAPSPDSDPLATWVGQGQRSGVANLMANQKNLAADLKTLEIEVQLAKTRLKEAATQLEHYTKGEAKIPERLDTLRFAVEKQSLEVELAVRRLELAKEQKNVKPNIPSPAP